jgi:hypothetical protein
MESAARAASGPRLLTRAAVALGRHFRSATRGFGSDNRLQRRLSNCETSHLDGTEQDITSLTAGVLIGRLVSTTPHPKMVRRVGLEPIASRSIAGSRSNQPCSASPRSGRAKFMAFVLAGHASRVSGAHGTGSIDIDAHHIAHRSGTGEFRRRNYVRCYGSVQQGLSQDSPHPRPRGSQPQHVRSAKAEVREASSAGQDGAASSISV